MHAQCCPAQVNQAATARPRRSRAAQEAGSAELLPIPPRLNSGSVQLGKGASPASARLCGKRAAQQVLRILAVQAAAAHAAAVRCCRRHTVAQVRLPTHAQALSAAHCASRVRPSTAHSVPRTSTLRSGDQRRRGTSKSVQAHGALRSHGACRCRVLQAGARPGATLFCSSRTSAMVSLSTTCFGRLESVESCTALLCDCGGTRSRSCAHRAASRSDVKTPTAGQGKSRCSKAFGTVVRLSCR